MADFKYKDYTESDSLKAAYAALEAQKANKPGEYQSAWQSQLDDITSKIQNRGPFSYDFNADPVYKQYKNQYVTQGKMAMQDTMGQAAALTGGYSNSYAATAGNQAYQGYLQQLNNVIPELYQIAYDRYNQEGQDLYNQYGLISDREAQDYSKYRDSVADYESALNYLTNAYNNERSYDYGKYTDEKNFAYGQYRDSVADEQWQKNFDEALRQYNEQMAYQKERDAVADAQWASEYSLSQQKFDYQQEQDRLAAEAAENTADFYGLPHEWYEKLEEAYNSEDETSARAVYFAMVGDGVDQKAALAVFNAFYPGIDPETGGYDTSVNPRYPKNFVGPKPA